jgi:hypothetical protein
MLRYVIRRAKAGKEPPWWVLFALYGGSGLLICLLPPYARVFQRVWWMIFTGSLCLLAIGWWLFKRFGRPARV